MVGVYSAQGFRRITLLRPVAPRSSSSDDRGRPRALASIRMTASFALLSSGGAVVLMASGPLSEGSTIASAEALGVTRSEEHTSELQSLMRTSYAVFSLKKTNIHIHKHRQ